MLLGHSTGVSFMSEEKEEINVRIVRGGSKKKKSKWVRFGPDPNKGVKDKYRGYNYQNPRGRRKTGEDDIDDEAEQVEVGGDCISTVTLSFIDF
ncbi:hypothetical protein Bca101_053608 [Brassica carinata]